MELRFSDFVKELPKRRYRLLKSTVFNTVEEGVTTMYKGEYITAPGILIWPYVERGEVELIKENEER